LPLVLCVIAHRGGVGRVGIGLADLVIESGVPIDVYNKCGTLKKTRCPLGFERLVVIAIRGRVLTQHDLDAIPCRLDDCHAV